MNTLALRTVLGRLLVAATSLSVVVGCIDSNRTDKEVEQRLLAYVTRDVTWEIAAPLLNRDGSGSGLDVKIALPDGSRNDCSSLESLTLRLPPSFTLVSESPNPSLDCDLGDVRPGQTYSGAFEGRSCVVLFVSILATRGDRAVAYPFLLRCSAAPIAESSPVTAGITVRAGADGVHSRGDQPLA